MIGVPFLALASTAAPTAGWQGAALIEAGQGTARDPQVAFDGSGNALAVWFQVDTVRSSMWANAYTAGSGWGAPTLLENDDVGNVETPQVAVDESGNAVAVWIQPDSTHANVWACRYTAGWGWGLPQLIETNSSGDARGPQVAVDANGNALAVWYQFDGLRFSIWANQYAAGSGWGTAALIETDDAGAAAVPQVEFDASGNAFAVWQQGDGTWDNIWASRYDSRSGWGRATLIETDDGLAGFAQIAFDGAGNALAVWMSYDGTWYNIWQNRYTAVSGWGTASLLESDDTGHAAAPHVGLDAGGDGIAVWVQSDGARYNIWATRYDEKTGWGTGALIETDNAGDASAAEVAVDPSGNAVAVWHQWDGSAFNVWANRFVVGSGWGSATILDTETGEAAFPKVAIDRSGNAIAVWRQLDGARHNIFSNLFVSLDATPPSIVISSPAPGLLTNSSAVWVAGAAEAGATVSVNGVAATVGAAGAFGLIVALQPGVNVIVATAWDAAGNSASASVSVNVTDPVAALEAQLAAAEANVTAAQSNLAAVAANASATQAQLDAARANLTAAQGRVATLETEAAATRDQLNATRTDLTAAQARVTALESNSSAAKADGAIARAQSDSAAGQVGLALMLAVAGVALGLVGTLLALRRGKTTVVKVPDSPPPSPPK